MMAPGGALAPFRFPAFRAIWTANMLSNMGSMVQSVAAAWLMTRLTDAHWLVALVQASTTLPILLFGVFAGAIADNFDRRRVMLTAQIGMLIVSGVLAFVTWQKAITPFGLLALVLLVGVGTALNGPAWQASVRAQVGRADLPHAISLNTISFNLARSVGPALGGLLISIWDISLAFAINALSYGILIAVLLRWKPEVAPPARTPMLRGIADGIRFCVTTPSLRNVLLRGAIVGVGVAAYQALLPVIVQERLHGNEVGFGSLLGAFGVGSILFALPVSKARRRFGSERVIGMGIFAFALATLMLAFSHSLLPAVPAALLAGAGWVVVMTTLNVAMQVRSPDAILGRCLSIYQAVTFGGMAVGAVLWGTVSDWLGLQATLLMAASWLMFFLLLLRAVAPMPPPVSSNPH